MDNMLDLAIKSGIEVNYHCFRYPIQGVYFVGQYMPPVIGLHYELKHDSCLLRSVMAEELGHHYTTVGECIPRKFYNYSNRLIISKVEYKALCWGANYLIKNDDLQFAKKEGLQTVSEFAEYFNITTELMRVRLEQYNLKNPSPCK